MLGSGAVEHGSVCVWGGGGEGEGGKKVLELEMRFPLMMTCTAIPYERIGIATAAWLKRGLIRSVGCLIDSPMQGGVTAR